MTKAGSHEGSIDVEVRAYEDGDLEDVLDIMRQPRCIRGTLQVPFQSPAAVRERHAKAEPGLYRLVAVVDEGEPRVVGMLGLHHLQRPRRAHAGTIGMFVHDHYQGRGVGTKLLAAAIELARNWLQISRLELEVFTDNEPAIRLYEKAGFQREGTLRRHVWRDGEFVDSYVMAWLRDS